MRYDGFQNEWSPLSEPAPFNPIAQEPGGLQVAGFISIRNELNSVENLLAEAEKKLFECIYE